MIEIFGVDGLPEVGEGDDLAALIAAAATLHDGDVVVVAQKVVSKAEGALVDVAPGEDRAQARRRVARAEAVRVVCDAPFALIVQTAHGLVCANAGIDASNVPAGRLALLPADPDASARGLRARLGELTGARVGVIVADTFGRPWRVGQTDVAIGVAGLRPIRDERGGTDRHGTLLEVTEVAVADELAAAADLVRRKADGVPVVVIRGAVVAPAEETGARDLVRTAEADLFPHGRGWLADALAVAPGQRDPAPRRGPVPPDELARAIRAAGGADVEAVEGGLIVRPASQAPSDLLRAGAAAAAVVAALLDLGYDASWTVADGAYALVQVGS